MKDLKLKYTVPFSFSEGEGEDEGKLFISGTAISATVTSNGHEFLTEELKPSAKTLANKPLLKDHINSVDAIVGRTVSSKFDAKDNDVKFKAYVKNKAMQDLIRDGLLDSVSVGAQVESVLYDDDREVMVLKGITFKELSLVAIGADPNANFATSFATMIHSATKSMFTEKSEFKEEPESDKEDGSEEAKTEEESTETKGDDSETGEESNDDETETTEEESEDTSNEDVEPQEKEDKKTEDKMTSEQITEKDAQIAELNKKLEESNTIIKEAEEQRLNDLKDSYKELAEEKGVKAMDVSEATEEVVKALVLTLESISSKVEEKTEAPKGIKGKTPTKTESSGLGDLEDYYVVKQGVIGGNGLFKSQYNAPKESVYFRGN